MNLLLTDPSPANQARASVMYNMIIEGVLAETGYQSFNKMLTITNAMPGLRQGLRLIQRDESRHIAYGVFLISRLVAADKTLWPVVEDQMYELFSHVQSDQQRNGTPEFLRAVDFAVYLLAHAGKFGGVSFCRVYGNWAAPATQRWQEVAAHYGMAPRHQHLPIAGKNGTDIALAVEAMDMFYSGIRRFCLASGDSDYTPLVRRLVEQGCLVVVIGRPDTSPALQQACTVFISTEQLQPVLTRGKKELTASASVAKALRHAPALLAESENPALQQLVLTAYSKIVTDTDNAWVALTHLGTVLKQTNPTFTLKAYGCATLKALIRKYAPSFQVEETTGGQAHIKLREQPDKPDA